MVSTPRAADSNRCSSPGDTTNTFTM
jgi:hypothetical protein